MNGYILLLPNAHRDERLEATCRLAQHLRANGHEVVIRPFLSDGLPEMDHPEVCRLSVEEAIAGADALNVDWNAQAVSKAEALLSRQAYSRDGLAKALEEEGFTAPEGAYGADNVGADWNAQAARKAQSYLQLRDLSKAQMRRQLNYDGFTQEQIEAALSAAGY